MESERARTAISNSKHSKRTEMERERARITISNSKSSKRTRSIYGRYKVLYTTLGQVILNYSVIQIDMEEAKRVIQELQADATTLEEENQGLHM